MTKLKVLLLNGSPHVAGCVFTALSEVGKTLAEDGVDSEIFNIGAPAVQGCVGCFRCRETGVCAFKDEVYLRLVDRLRDVQGIVIGSPVYYAGPAGSLCALLDRVFFSAGKLLRGKCGAAMVNCRRGGASAAFDRLNKYFTISRMPVVSSQYWNSTHGFTPAEVLQDLEGMQTMRTLAHNMAYLMKSLAASPVPPPEPENPVMTSFIR